MSVLTGDNPFADLKEKKGPCWTGYKKVPGKKDFEDGSCVKAEETETEEDKVEEALPAMAVRAAVGVAAKKIKSMAKSSSVEEDKKGHFRSTEAGAGMTAKGAKAAGVKTAVTTPPSKLDPDSKPAKRRKSFCARSKSWNGERGKAARRRWNC